LVILKVMSLEQERLSPKTFMLKWVRLEHLARFRFGAEFVKDKVVVDCACGSGVGSKIFAEAGAKEVRAFDVDEEEIRNCGIAALRNDLPEFAVADARRLPLPDNFADVYISFETIEHIEGDLEYLQEAKRILKSNGIFICSTPNRLITNPGKTISDKPWNKFHVREYSRQEFVDLLSKYFGKVELYGQNPVCALRAKMLNTIGRMFPLYGAVRLNQIVKLPRFIYDTERRHRVMEIREGYEYEYLVAVCYS